MMRPAITPAAVAALWLACPCGWQGRGSQAVVKRYDLLGCPRCHRPVTLLRGREGLPAVYRTKGM